MRVTRIAYSVALNAGKYAELVQQARRLGRVRSEVWQRYGSIAGVGAGLSAKVEVRRAITQRTNDPAERKRMFTALATNRWTPDPFLSRQMRMHWRRGRNRTHDQIVVRADRYNTVVDEQGRLWLAVPGLQRRQTVKIPLSTTVPPTGTLRLILRGGRVEVNYQLDASLMRSSQRPCGDRVTGVDKGYTEVLTDSDGYRHGTRLGDLLTCESDRLKERNRRRAKLRSIANTAALRGDRAKARRIRANNLGTAKRDRQAAQHRARVRTEIFTAVHRVVDKAATVIAEDPTKPFAGRKRLGKTVNRRLAAWTRGGTAEALRNVSDILQRAGDPDIALHTPHHRVRQLLQERTDRHRARLPVQDSSSVMAERRANYPSRSAMSTVGSRRQL